MQQKPSVWSRQSIRTLRFIGSLIIGPLPPEGTEHYVRACWVLALSVDKIGKRRVSAWSDRLSTIIIIELHGRSKTKSSRRRIQLRIVKLWLEDFRSVVAELMYIQIEFRWTLVNFVRCSVISSHQRPWCQIWRRESTDVTLSYDVKNNSISWTVWAWLTSVTDVQTNIFFSGWAGAYSVARLLSTVRHIWPFDPGMRSPAWPAGDWSKRPVSKQAW